MTDTTDSADGKKPDAGNGQDGSRRVSMAVALHYQPDSEFAPKVVAGGRGGVAEQILQVAFAAGVKVREDADLAEMLTAIDIDSEIPIEAFAAVAEILAYIYRLNGNLPEFANSNEPTPSTEYPHAPG